MSERVDLNQAHYRRAAGVAVAVLGLLIGCVVILGRHAPEAPQKGEIRQRYENRSTDELLDILTHAADYTPEAIAAVRDELAERQAGH